MQTEEAHHKVGENEEEEAEVTGFSDEDRWDEE